MPDLNIFVAEVVATEDKMGSPPPKEKPKSPPPTVDHDTKVQSLTLARLFANIVCFARPPVGSSKCLIS